MLPIIPSKLPRSLFRGSPRALSTPTSPYALSGPHLLPPSSVNQDIDKPRMRTLFHATGIFFFCWGCPEQYVCVSVWWKCKHLYCSRCENSSPRHIRICYVLRTRRFNQLSACHPTHVLTRTNEISVSSDIQLYLKRNYGPIRSHTHITRVPQDSKNHESDF